MRKAWNLGPKASEERPGGALQSTPDAVEASGNAARSAHSDAAAAPALLGAGSRWALPEAPRPSDPKRRSFTDPGNRAEASGRDAAGSAAAEAPSTSPPFPARGLHDGLISLPGAGPNRPANRPEDIPDEAQGATGASESEAPQDSSPRLPSPRLSGRLAALAETAKAYARSAQADNTQRAYAADWRHFASWLRRQGLPETPPDAEAVGLYLAAQVERHGAELSVATLERRLSGIAWRYRQLGQPLEIRDRHIATVLAGIRRRHGRPPLQKAAIFADELLAMLATLDMDLRGLRDRAILAMGFAGGLRRSEIVGLDCGPRQSEDGSGWIEILPEGALLTIRGKTGWRDVEIGRGSRADTCPVALLETWLRLGRIGYGPLFRAIARRNGGVSGERLTDKHVVRLVQKCALAAGLRGDLAEGERRRAFGGHSLRAGLASSAQIEEAHVQKHLGHASAEMTRRYQRKRDRFTINLTKAAGL
jgi:integrase